MVRRLLVVLYCIVLTTGLGLPVLSNAADEPSDRVPQETDFNHLCNVRRTGFTSTQLPPPYQLVWTYKSRHKPRPAWREPAWETQRIDLDYAYALAADSETVYIVSSSDHAVHALDLESGQPRWRHFSEGPIRLAPTVHRA